MDTKNSNLEKTIERAEKGEFKEYWLQWYIKDNYKKLGFNSFEGPFEIGYDFRGVYKGDKAVVEAETQSRNFIYHRHDPNEVNILIVLNNDITDEVLGMKPTEWRKSLPKKIYLKFYNINLKEFISKEKEGSVIVTRIEDLARDLFESRRKFSDLKDEEKEFVVSWLEVFRTEYISRL